MAKKLMLVFGVVMIFLLLNFVNAKSFSPIDQRYIETGQNQEWFYTKIQKADGTKEYIGINKLSRGAMGIADQNEFFGSMWLVPAFKHPTNSEWYLCPLIDMQGLNSYSDLGNGWYFSLSDPALTCYQYPNTAVSGNANMDIEISFVTDTVTAETKININTTVNGISPSDTGFAFIFFPENPARYRFIQMNGNVYDLAGVEGQLPADKVFEFLDSNQNPIGHIFDWTDMLDVGNRYAEILTIGGQKALMVGTYGYGASNTINIDPIYQVDYSPTPAKHLLFGEVDFEPESSFDATLDITVGLSDNISITNYETRLGSIFQTYNPELTLSFNLDETSGSYVYDLSGNEKNGSVNGNTILNTTGILNTSIYVDGNNDYILIPVTDGVVNLDSGEEGVYCISFNTTDSGVLFSISSNSLSSMKLELLSNGKMKATMRRSGGATTITSSGTYDDNNWHTTCLASSESNTMFLFVDGFLVGYATQSLQAKNYTNIRLGVAYDLTNDFEGKLDEFCIWQGSITTLATIVDYETDKCGQGNSVIIEEGKAISGKFSQIYNSTYTWFLEIYKYSTGTTDYVIYAYDDEDNLSNISVSQIITGTGWVSQNVSGLMDYMTNTVGLNYSMFRLYTTDEHDISELRLRQILDDNIAPSINSCFLNDTAIGCFESIELSCNITDDSLVDEVYYQLNGENYTTVQEIDDWLYNFNLMQEGNTFYDWEYVYAIDILNNQNITDPSLNFTYNCTATDYINIHNFQISVGFTEVNISWDTDLLSDTKVEYGNTTTFTDIYLNLSDVLSHSVKITNLTINTTYYYNITSSIDWLFEEWGQFNFTTGVSCNWEAEYDSCLINDSQLKYYNETNNCGRLDGLPFDNGTYVYCNYCSEDLIQTYPTQCFLNGSQGIRQVLWFDNNYFSCCALTGIVSDCSIDYYPFNESYYENCTFLRTDFEIELDTDVTFGFGFDGLASDKVHGKIWLNDTNNTYYCISYVKTILGKIVQTNPPYTKRTTSTITIVPKQIEDREFFITQNGLANVYWTSDNLVIDGRTYFFGVECSGNDQRLISELASIVGYDKVNAPVTRWFWFLDNMWTIILGMIILFFIILALGFYIKELRSR